MLTGVEGRAVEGEVLLLERILEWEEKFGSENTDFVLTKYKVL